MKAAGVVWRHVATYGVAVLFIGAMPVGADTYYVSQSSGDDSWNGRAANPDGNGGPWKTLAKASTARLAPGDRVLLRHGDIWNEEFRPQGNGTAQNPIVIGSYGEGDRRPVIDRADFTKDLIGIRLSDQEGFKIVGVEFNRCMTGIYADYPDNGPARRFLWIEDCYFHDSLLYQRYENYPVRKIGLGVCLFSHERDNRIVLADITVRNCVFRRLASGFWTNSPDNFNKNASFVYNFGNLTFEDCLFEEGYQWQLGIRGVAGGAVRNCVTHDIGRGFRAFNGVAGGMFFRCKDWIFENSEWGFVDIGLGSGDGEAFDFEGNCDNMTMRNCLFHDTDGPGFLLCCYASDGHPNKGILMENCVLNGKSKRPIGLPRCEIINTTDWTESTWKKCRFYLSPGETLMKVMDPEKDKKTTFVDCVVKNLGDACRGSPNLALKATITASSQEAANGGARAIDGREDTFWKAATATDQWLQLVFPGATTVNSFRIREGQGSSISRYAIECWDERATKWVRCFNGMATGPEFMAPVVSRTTRKVRLIIVGTASGNPAVAEFEVYNDTGGWISVTAAGQPGK